MNKVAKKDMEKVFVRKEEVSMTIIGNNRNTVKNNEALEGK